MKLIFASVAGLASAAISHEKSVLNAMPAVSDECVGCENAPKPVYECQNPPCDSTVCGAMSVDLDSCDGDTCAVDCSLEEGYYADNADCRSYCFCSGTDNVDGHGVRVPSRWHTCPAGTVWSPGCGGYFEELSNGVGHAGGCCDHPNNVLNFANCPGACERLTKYNCKKSNTCSWDDDCNCCKSGGGGNPEPAPGPTCAANPIDLVFVLDGSGSVGKVNFAKSKYFLKRVVARLGADSRVATVQYSTAPALEFPFTSNYDSIFTVVDAIPYQGKSTKTGEALKFTETTVCNTRRPDVGTVVLVLTDGVSYDDAANDVSIRGPEIAAANGGVDVFALGVAKADMSQLRHIASDDANAMMASWDTLDEVVDELAERLCATPPPFVHEPPPVDEPFVHEPPPMDH